MQFNGQGIFLNHIIAKRSDPNNAAKLQRDMDAFRLKQAYEAASVRPVFLPLQFSMTAAGATSPYRDSTASLGYEVLITGIKADERTRDIIIRHTATDKSLCYIGGETSLYLRADDIAGQAVTNGGSQLGTFYLPTPILLKPGHHLNVEMYKTDTTADPEIGNIVFVGVRIFKGVHRDLLIDTEEKALIEQQIKMREIPETIFLKQLINFASAGVGGYARNKFTPESVDEPLLVLGCRTTLRQSMIEIGVQGEPQWTVEPTPIWGVAGEDGLSHDNYQWFSRPIYLQAGNTILSTVKNSIDGTLFDAQTGKTITWICRTV